MCQTQRGSTKGTPISAFLPGFGGKGTESLALTFLLSLTLHAWQGALAVSWKDHSPPRILAVNAQK